MDLQTFLEKLRFSKVLRIAIGSSVAILLAEAIGLEYSTSAGIITFLTVQDTKKETLKLALNRLFSYFVTILLAFILLRSSFDYLRFGLFMLGLVGISYVAGWEGAISVNAVIGTHFLVKTTFNPLFALNELILVLIGSCMGVLVNLYMPKKDKNIMRDIDRIEERMSEILKQMAEDMENLTANGKDDRQLKELEAALDKSLQKAHANYNNTLQQHSTYFISYLEMRRQQCMLLANVRQGVYSLTQVPEQAELIAAFIAYNAESLNEEDNVVELRRLLDMILEHMERHPLPESKEEFYNFIHLYHILKDFEEYITVKEDFIASLTEEQIELYWKE